MNAGYRFHGPFSTLHVVPRGAQAPDGGQLVPPSRHHVLAFLAHGSSLWSDRELDRLLADIGMASGATLSSFARERRRERLIDALQHRFALYEVPRRPARISPEPHDEAVLGPLTAEHPTWFEARVVDELGQPIGGLDLSFTYDGRRNAVTTTPTGRARLDGVTATRAAASVASVQAARDRLKPRWEGIRGAATVKAEGDVVVWRLREDVLGLDLTNERPRTLSLQPWVEHARLIGGIFEKNKCFVLPVGVQAVRGLVRAYAQRRGAQLLIVGHTDTTGTPAYNDPLSLERATSMAAYLKNDVEAWYAWYSERAPLEKRWGTNEDLDMIGALPNASDRDPLEGSVRWYQRTRGLKVDGIAGKDTRHVLLAEYMALDGTSLPADAAVQIHGCGENFPRDPAEGGAEDPDDRRIELFFFDARLGVQPAPPGRNSRKGDPQYPEWLARAGAPIDFTTDDDDVVLELEWSLDLIDALGPDAAMTLSSDASAGVEKRDLAHAERSAGIVRVSFAGLERGQKVTLTATAAGKTLVLAKDQVASDFTDPLAWDHRLDDLLEL